MDNINMAGLCSRSSEFSKHLKQVRCISRLASFPIHLPAVYRIPGIMKIFAAITLLCLVGLAVSYPAQEDEFLVGRRNIRRRNQVSPPAPLRRRQSEPSLPVYQPSSRPKKANVQYSPESALPSAPQERYAVKPSAPKRKAPVQQAAEPTEEREYVAEASDVYAGSYDDSHLKFEQGVQNNANSYNSDQGVKDGRVQFSIAGQQGPNSYRFGYDTGKGADRTFRIEERDAAGIVHGRYGYYDPSGKFRIVNYSAHPEHGFQAEGNFAPN